VPRKEPIHPGIHHPFMALRAELLTGLAVFDPATFSLANPAS
jgi:hypothetical protein